MAVLLRRGFYKDFNPNKLLAGELAVILGGDPRAESGRSLYACFSPGVVKQIATYEDMVNFLKASMTDAAEQLIEELATQFMNEIQTATNEAANAAEAANVATQNITELQTQIQKEESNRVSAEAKRQQDSTKAINEAENAAQAANDAAEAANTAAQAGKNYEGTLESFPETGKTGVSYIDIETNTTYRWDTNTSTYIPLGGGKDLSIVSDEYKSGEAYSVGDYFIKENTLYKVIKDKPAGEWDETAVKPTTVGVEFQDLNAKLEPVVLWENPNPNTAFSAQTISMDLSAYKRFVIQFGTINYSRLADFTIHKGGRYGCSYAFSSADVSGVLLAERFVTTSDSGISFEDAIQTNPSTKPVNNNTRMVPRKIWGYKTD